MAFHTFDTGPTARSTADRPFSDINVTPLVDVMLVLLVIFILTAPLLTSAIRLDLPRTPAARPVEAAHALVLVIDKDGVAYLEDQAQTPQTLLSRLQREAKAHPDTEVQLRADAAVPYGRMVEVIGLAQRAGLSRVGFVAEGQPPAAKP